MSTTTSGGRIKSFCRYWLGRLRYKWANWSGTVHHYSPYYDAEMRSLQADLQAEGSELNQILFRYQNAFDHAPMSYLFVDRHGYISKVNKTASYLLNIQNRFAEKLPKLIDFVSSESRAAFLNVFDQALATPDAVKSQQIQLKIPRNLRSHKIDTVISVTLKTDAMMPGEGDYRYLVTLFPLGNDSWPVYQAP